MGQHDATPLLTPDAFHALLEKIAEEGRLITHAVVAQRELGLEGIPEDEHPQVAAAIFQSHFQLPFAPFLHHVIHTYMGMDFRELRKAGFDDAHLGALRAPLFNSYAFGALIGWLLHEHLGAKDDESESPGAP